MFKDVSSGINNKIINNKQLQLWIREWDDVRTFLWKILKKLTYQCMVFLLEYDLIKEVSIFNHTTASHVSFHFSIIVIHRYLTQSRIDSALTSKRDSVILRTQPSWAKSLFILV